MVHIKISKGLDIPIKGKPQDNVHALVPGGQATALAAPARIGLDLKPFADQKFKLLVKIGDTVKVGEPILEDKALPGVMVVSPAGGTVEEINRGNKRVLESIVIATASQEQYQEWPILNTEKASRQEILNHLKSSGCFARIRSRPFNLLANPEKLPRCIFVKAVESAPLAPPSELHVQGHEKEFQTGLKALAKLTDGPIHLVYAQNTTCKAFTEAQNVRHHTVEGPHPVGNVSLHIQRIDPIRSVEDSVWTINAPDVVLIGHLLMHGRYAVERIISIAGPGFLPDRIGFFKVREGYPISLLVSGRLPKGVFRLISGDPLMGEKVEEEDYLGFYHYVFCAIRENFRREFLHFFRLGMDKYSFSKTYLSGHLDNKEREYDFTTNQHGEHRAFIDSTLYDQVQPLNIPTMLLVKAVMAEDYELADTLGLLEVDSEDFALPAFVCPSKIEMPDIIKTGLKQYAQEVLV